jgi:hypothetical protein
VAARGVAFEIDIVRAAGKSVVGDVDVGRASHRDVCANVAPQIDVVARDDVVRHGAGVASDLNPIDVRIRCRIVGNKVVEIVVLDRATIRLQPDAVFDPADTATLHRRIVSKQNIDAGVAAAPCNGTILDRTATGVECDRLSLTILYYYARIVDNDAALNIEPINDLSSVARGEITIDSAKRRAGRHTRRRCVGKVVLVIRSGSFVACCDQSTRATRTTDALTLSAFTPAPNRPPDWLPHWFFLRRFLGFFETSPHEKRWRMNLEYLRCSGLREFRRGSQCLDSDFVEVESHFSLAAKQYRECGF